MYFFLPNNNEAWNTVDIRDWYTYIVVVKNNRAISITIFETDVITGDFPYYYNLVGVIE